jgi:hypothetical protein
LENGDLSLVYDPFEGIPAGYIQTTVSADNLTINTTLPVHVFYDGQITRTAWRAPDGSWHVTTRGIGNNVVPGMNKINEMFGPEIFDALDRQMRENIERHHRGERLLSN